MRLSLRTIVLLLFVFLGGFAISSRAQSITSLSKYTGSPGDQITITGALGKSPGGLYLGGTLIAPDAPGWGASSITFTIPVNTAPGAVVIKVQQGGTYASTPFTVEPHITSINANSGPVGSVLKISGAGFGTAAHSTRILFTSVAPPVNEVPAEVHDGAWTATAINLTVPAGLTVGTSYMVHLKDSGFDVNAGLFTIDTAPLVQPPLSMQATAGSPVTLSGSDFTNTQGTVALNSGGASLPMAVTAWTNNKIAFSIPPATPAGSYNIAVTANGVPANPSASSTSSERSSRS